MEFVFTMSTEMFSTYIYYFYFLKNFDLYKNGKISFYLKT